ncbi:hypothetical protein, partial [Colwellia sp. C1TZA3]|uniref:hypothetical protein n=1 Tax=Colwellia sp. C1TZA3 TaxID=2508879 RepID=UPI001CB9CE25
MNSPKISIISAKRYAQKLIFYGNSLVKFLAEFSLRDCKSILVFKRAVIPISLSYCSLVLVKIAQGCVALNPNSQLLLNRAPYLELFFLRTTRS